MKINDMKKLFYLLLASLALKSCIAEDEPDGPFKLLAEQYESLSPKGKFAAGATVGFIGSRLALGTVTKVVKLGAAAFVTTEALKMTGILDDLPQLSQEQSDLIAKAKTSVLRTAEDFRVQMRRRLSQEGIQKFFDDEKMTALGLTGGAIAGALL